MAKNKSYDTADMLSGFITKPKTQEITPKENMPEPKEVEAAVITEKTKINDMQELKEPPKKAAEKKNAPQKIEKTAQPKAPIFSVPAKENKSKATSILIKPSLHEKVKQKCADEGISFNELINQMLEWWLTQ